MILSEEERERINIELMQNYIEHLERGNAFDHQAATKGGNQRDAESQDPGQSRQRALEGDPSR